MNESAHKMHHDATASVLITHDVGLHARPSVKFTKLAKSFPARIEMASGEDAVWIDAKSIVKVMATRAPKGTMLQLRAAGERAEEALRALVELVERDFDEGADHAQSA